MKIIHNIKLPITSSHIDAKNEALKVLKFNNSTPCYIYKESIDRRKNQLSKVFSVAIDTEIEHPLLSPLKKYDFLPKNNVNINKTPYIIGMGPAGMFCALTLIEYGLKPIIVERGQPLEQRIKDVESFWAGGELNESSNVQFGEGGAGTFSDGKLTTRINDPRCRKVLETFVKHGAPEDILYKAKPHIGTDILRKVVINIRKEIIDKGGKILFNSTFNDLKISNRKVNSIYINNQSFSANELVLAVGNGAFDTFKLLLEKKEFLTEIKPCSFGFRQEHLQSDINLAQYGKNIDLMNEIDPQTNKPFLEAADYSFYKHLSPSVCVYTFCMCPGGQVVNASSNNGRLVTNGMSLNSRDGQNANAALLVNYTPKSIIEAMELQELIESNAFNVTGGKAAPICRGNDLLTDSITNIPEKIKPTYLPETKSTNFSKIFPKEILSSLQKGAVEFNKTMFREKNFEPAVYTAPETRGINGIYPCGEGAGYAGGIMSSAVDGIRVAEAIINKE